MTESLVIEKLEILTATVAKLKERIEHLEDLRDLEAAVAENAGRPLVPWEGAKKRLELD